MKYKLSIFLTLVLSLNAMDAPQSETESVPLKMQDFDSKEKRKFRNYNLDHPEKFLGIMREQFNYKGNKEQYLKQVQTLASVILAQHISMHNAGETTFFTNYHYKLKDDFYQLVHRLHGKILQNELIEFDPETSEQLNILLSHKDIVREPRVFSEPELLMIFSWIIDKEKGTWLNNLGLLQKNIHEGLIEQSNSLQSREKMENPIFPAPGTTTTLFRSNEQLIKENSIYGSKLLSETQSLQELEGRASADTTEKASRAYEQTLAQLAQLYRIHQSEYQKLYEIVRKELFDTYKLALGMGTKNLSALLMLPIPEYQRKSNAIPNKFPEKLETIKNPATYLTHASLDAELEKMRIKWDKSQEIKPKIKKKIRQRKRVPADIKGSELNIEKEIEIIEPIEKIKKIKIGSDGSYIAEGTENDLQIIIEDPAHDSTVTIFKTKSTPENNAKLKTLPKINYTSWVTEWFENPEKAILTHGYKDPKNLRYRAGESDWLPIVLHAFPKLVDEYIYQYGSVSQTPSRKAKGKNDIMVTIPGKMEYPDGKEDTGVFTYLIDKDNGLWFHRMFTPSSHKKMAADFIEKGYFAPEVKGYYDVYFPPLPK